MPNHATNPYDEVPFPSQPVRHTQPARLEAIATLFGMRPAAADRCRVLELGCATGGNLIALADRFPKASFVGVDYSPVQIQSAQQTATELGLTNLELRCASITDLGAELGTFDYILCHGVFTWVPRAVQDAILGICRRALNPQGVAYISYNTYPAWHLRSLARRLMRGGEECGADDQQVVRGRARLAWLAGAIAGDQTAYSRLLTVELDAILKQPDDYLLHEYLEGDNQPHYFHEFADRAAAAELRYLGDAEPSTMFAANYGRATAERLQRITDERISAEQHLDALCNRGFRKTLLCHQEIEPAGRLLPDRVDNLHFSGKFVPYEAAPDLRSWSSARFTTASGTTVSHSAPPVKALLHYLGAQWPRSLSIDELTLAVAGLLAPNGQQPDTSAAVRELVVLNVVQFVASGLVDPSGIPDSFTTTVSRCPRVSALARLQARGSTNVTNGRHETVQLDEQSCGLLAFVDGQHDQEALLATLLQAVQAGEISGPGADSTELSNALHQWLTSLAAQALLVS